MTTTGPPDSHELLTKAERLMSKLQQTAGEVVGERQLAKEVAARKAQLYVAVAIMSLITIFAVMVTVALLREPGPPGPHGPIPVTAQFIRDDAGCLFRVMYRTPDGGLVPVDARTSVGACHG